MSSTGPEEVHRPSSIGPIHVLDSLSMSQKRHAARRRLRASATCEAVES